MEGAVVTELRELVGHRCLVVTGGEAAIRSVQDMIDLVGEAMSQSASAIVLPLGALDDAFFDLRSGFAGEVLQKAANYRIKLAIVGDVSAHIATSKAFRDLVAESSYSRTFLFAPDFHALEARFDNLGPGAEPRPRTGA
jgi:hypothetical protein